MHECDFNTLRVTLNNDFEQIINIHRTAKDVQHSKHFNHMQAYDVMNFFYML
jgi:hypothetical protein